MLDSGEDVKYIIRRMIISASEDIGLADPQALLLTEAGARSFERIGLPEGRLILSQMALYLASAPKSNTTLAINQSSQWLREVSPDVPLSLQNVQPNSQGEHFHADYLYPHDYPEHWVAQSYLPSSFVGRVLYEPTDQGYEKGLQRVVAERRQRVSEVHKSALTSSQHEEASQDSWQLAQALSEILKEGEKRETILLHENLPPSLFWNLYHQLKEFSTPLSLFENGEKEGRESPQNSPTSTSLSQHPLAPPSFKRLSLESILKEGVENSEILVVGEISSFLSSQKREWMKEFRWIGWLADFHRSSHPGDVLPATFLHTARGREYWRFEQQFYSEIFHKSEKLYHEQMGEELKDKERGQLPILSRKPLSRTLLNSWLETEPTQREGRFSHALAQHFCEESLKEIREAFWEQEGRTVPWRRVFTLYGHLLD